jgi:hypothetical protein
MAPPLQALARSDSKTKFFQRLGLSSQKSSDNQLYDLMKVGLTQRKRMEGFC